MSNWINDVNVFLEDGSFHFASVQYADRIERIVKKESGKESSRYYLIPGLIDIHTHGAAGYDVSDGTKEALHRLSAYYVEQGVTGFCAATMTLPESRLIQVIKTTADFENPPGARLLGVTMEGPFINEKNKGAQSDKHIKEPDSDMMERIFHVAKGRIRMICLASEIKGAKDFIRAWHTRCVISLAHTSANYEEAKTAFDLGCSHVTHLYNAMNPFLSREPGVVGAAADSGAFVELICDGIHIHPSVIRSTFRMFGKDRVCLISDSMRCAGLPDGVYELGGNDVYVSSGIATLADGTLAGSSINMITALRNTVRFGIPLEEAVAAATHNPAMSIGYQEGGSIAVGKYADFVLMDEDLNIVDVIVGGKSALGK